jgi:phosphatidylglycerophosphate synthase
MTAGYEPVDRRPIATRNHRWAQAVARWLADRNVSANAISISGLVAGVLGGVALAATGFIDGPSAQRALWICGAVMVQLRLLANMLDGMVALESGKASAVGELYNEVPDRISDAATLIGLGYAAGGNAALGYLAACLALFTAYVRAQGKAAGANAEFCGPMAKPQRMFVVTLAALAMALMPGAWSMHILARTGLGLPAWALALIVMGCIITAIRRLARIARTLRGAGA